MIGLMRSLVSAVQPSTNVSAKVKGIEHSRSLGRKIFACGAGNGHVTVKNGLFLFSGARGPLIKTRQAGAHCPRD